MTDLIVHIGFPKCGSSTLQQLVFVQEAGYLGTAPTIPIKDNLGKQLQRCGPFSGRQTLNRRFLHQWAVQVRNMHRSRWPDIDRLILSDEFLASKSRFESQPVIRLLAYLKNNVWVDGRVRVILVLRSQVTRLASQYAEASNLNYKPGQNGFEKFVSQSLKYTKFWDYILWIENLERTLGADNVCVLVLEEAGTDEFWGSLADFCELQTLDPKEMAGSKNRKNVRHDETENTWQIRPFDPAFKAKAKVDTFLNFLWPRSLLDTHRHVLRQRFIDRLSIYYRLQYERRGPSTREGMISINDYVISEVRRKCGQSNQRLSRHLGRDLQALGYVT